MLGVLAFVGGLSFFLFGMTEMGEGLSALSGGRLEGFLSRACRTPLRGVLFGALVTAAIQSSSATTVMVVGFVSGGVMSLSAAASVIMGANLGTTVTAWILSLAGLSGDTPLLLLLQPSGLSPLLAAAGLLLLFKGKNEGRKSAGRVLFGFALLFSGMEGMSEAVKPLAALPQFGEVLSLLSNPLAGLAAGALLTALIQSSSASIGILQALSATGAIRLSMAVPIVMGQNIGTCVTALLSGLGARKTAKQAALLHLYFNTIGATVLLFLFLLLSAFGIFPSDMAVREGDVAAIHTVFNVSATLLLLPATRLLLRLTELTVDKVGRKRVNGKK